MSEKKTGPYRVHIFRAGFQAKKCTNWSLVADALLFSGSCSHENNSELMITFDLSFSLCRRFCAFEARFISRCKSGFPFIPGSLRTENIFRACSFISDSFLSGEEGKKKQGKVRKAAAAFS